ncbi:unnamed protein product [Phytophthora fragariaefolia]|uniref:Unnamed protein product n=1 Tax=Phytophthora fragariaefolia TaxID=1490495 RepID=A0A9W6XJZ2_9STRA|nr:unnamed protein product [Phytophthora fragariaefolia]
MLNVGVIEEGNRACGFPVALVRKKDGEVRFCVDYRSLNTITKKDVHPLPRIDETLEALGGALLFTTLDIRAGYWRYREASNRASECVRPAGDSRTKVKVEEVLVCHDVHGVTETRAQLKRGTTSEATCGGFERIPETNIPHSSEAIRTPSRLLSQVRGDLWIHHAPADQAIAQGCGLAVAPKTGVRV